MLFKLPRLICAALLICCLCVATSWKLAMPDQPLMAIENGLLAATVSSGAVYIIAMFR